MKIIVQQPVVDHLGASFYRIDLVGEPVQLNVIGVLMKGPDSICKVAGFWQAKLHEIGDGWYEENKEKWAKDQTLRYILVHNVAQDEDDE